MMAPPYFKKPEGELLVTRAIRKLAGYLPGKSHVAKPTPKKVDTFEKIYNAFVAAETSSRSFDPLRDSDQGYWRRTVAKNTPRGSTAYGPVQITKTLFKDMLENRDRYGVQTEDIPYLGLLAKQGEDFAKHGNNRNKIPDYRQEYDYGGKGILADPEFVKHENIWKQKYKELAIKAMKEHYQRAGSIEGMVELWRGKKPQEDPDYYKRFYSKYNG